MKKDEFDAHSYIKYVTDNPFKQAPEITIRQFAQVNLHLKKCEECVRLVNETNEKYKNIPSKSIDIERMN